MTGRAGRFARDEHAASMVEFAIIAPLLFLFLFAIIDFGRALFLYNNLQDTARRAARVAAVQSVDPCAAGSPAVTAAKDDVSVWVQEFNNSPTAAATVKGYVSLSCVYATPGVAANVQVTISNYPFRSITPVPYLSTLKITKSAGVRNEYAPVGF